MNRQILRISSLFTVLLLASMLIYSCKNDATNNNDSNDQFPVDYNANLNLSLNSPLTISLVKYDHVKKIAIYLNDSLLKTENAPFKVKDFSFNIASFGIGLKELKLKATKENGQEFEDSQKIKVVSDIMPEQLSASIVTTYPHDPTHFTQGLEIVNGSLYEGTGDPDHIGATKVMEKNLTTGAIIKEVDLDGNYFGEGISILKDKLYQLTWTSQKCFVYSFPSLEKTSVILPYTGEGWGLTNDGNNLIMSDGSERIFFRDPNTFSIRRIIEVYDNVGPIKQLNELEYVDGIIYANVWMTNKIVAIDAKTGKVLKSIDCTNVVSKDRGKGDVLNGIAYDHSTGKFYVTGKYWPELSEVVFK